MNHILFQKTGAAVPLRLLHGAAWLEDTHSMGGDAEAGGSWFDGRKRGILAPFAVGTIDQALMAVLNVRHGTVRDFGLAGKVVILDEVHSYDTYTGTLLNELVSRLRALKCTVIILSATLTDAQKREILKLDNSVVLDADYPLITSLKDKEPAGAALHQLASEQGTPHTVLVERCTEDEQAICMAIERAEAGDQVLWIENTVGGSCWIHRAKEEFEGEYGKALLKKLGIEGEWEGIGHCILGYPDGGTPAAARRLDNRVHWIK